MYGLRVIAKRATIACVLVKKVFLTNLISSGVVTSIREEPPSLRFRRQASQLRIQPESAKASCLNPTGIGLPRIVIIYKERPLNLTITSSTVRFEPRTQYFAYFALINFQGVLSFNHQSSPLTASSPRSLKWINFVICSNRFLERGAPKRLPPIGAYR